MTDIIAPPNRHQHPVLRSLSALTLGTMTTGRNKEVPIGVSSEPNKGDENNGPIGHDAPPEPIVFCGHARYRLRVR